MWRTSGRSPYAARVASWTLPQKMPIRSLVRFFSAARPRLLPSYDAPGHEPTARIRPNASSSRASSASGRYQSRTVSQVAARSPASSSRPRSMPAADDAVLEVVHRVGDVVGEVHHLRLDGTPRALDPLAQPAEDGHGRRRTPRTCEPLALPRPRVLGAGVERRPGQVEPDGGAVGGGRLGLEPGQDPQRLGVALEPAAVGGQGVQRDLAVVPERRVPQVVGQRRGLGEVGVAAERVRQVAGHLGHLEAVGQPVAHEVVGLRAEHLRLGGEPAQRRGVHHPRPVTLERRALRRRHPLGRLVDQPLARGVVVQLVPGHGGDAIARRSERRAAAAAGGRAASPWRS